jgi:hypothetical protein
MKVVIKILLSLISLGLGFFIFLIGQMGDEGTNPPPFIWYALLVVLFGIPIILIATIGKEKGKR